jgi:RNA polymerase sigma-70 factor, ECF subfamily
MSALPSVSAVPPSPVAGRTAEAVAAESELVVRVRAGDVEAYGVLLLTHGHSRRLRAWLAARALDPDAVEELAQDAFVTAFQQIRKFRPGSDFGAWLRGIAWQLLRQSRKKFAVQQKHAARILAELATENNAVAPDDPMIEFLEQCLERVPENTRALLQQKYRDGMSTAEMSAAASQSAEWVRLTLYRTRRQLRECINQRRHAAGA